MKTIDYKIGNELVTETIKVIDEIKDFIVEQWKNADSDDEKIIVSAEKVLYITQKNLDELFNEEYFQDFSKISKLSLNMSKKLNRRIFWFRGTKSMERANRLLHFLFRHVLHIPCYIKITKCNRELEIDKLRKEWKVRRNEADKAIKIYKERKGDYYKKQL